MSITDLVIFLPFIERNCRRTQFHQSFIWRNADLKANFIDCFENCKWFYMLQMERTKKVQYHFFPTCVHHNFMAILQSWCILPKKMAHYRLSNRIEMEQKDNLSEMQRSKWHHEDGYWQLPFPLHKHANIDN